MLRSIGSLVFLDMAIIGVAAAAAAVVTVVVADVTTDKVSAVAAVVDFATIKADAEADADADADADANADADADADADVIADVDVGVVARFIFSPTKIDGEKKRLISNCAPLSLSWSLILLVAEGPVRFVYAKDSWIASFLDLWKATFLLSFLGSYLNNNHVLILRTHLVVYTLNN